ncbi:hypothetical protein F4780DRAFT_718956 [Xylariomycetidae sp. FL0641]|nr:hypothetical protein F4780DRAFT_718956 [Xylariomycetidae sp. FL0641]
MSDETPRSRCLVCKLRKVKCSGGPEPCANCCRLHLQAQCTFRYSLNRTSEPSLQPALHTPTDSLTEAGTARIRTSAACDQCRMKKAKCSGHQPRCYRCAQRNLACFYSQRRSRPSGSSQSDIPSKPTLKHNEVMSPSTLDPDETSPISIDVSADKSFLRKDMIFRHLEAYFEYLYPLQGLDFLHKPSILEDFQHDRIPPIFSTAICAAVAMYIAPSKEARALSIEWAKDVDHYIFTNMNRVEILSLKLMVLSMFQHFAYRQFGRVWLMLGMATRLALALQLNDDQALSQETSSFTQQECHRRIMWSLFIQDKLLSGGVDEFVSLPSEWMRLSLPASEYAFQHECHGKTGTLADGMHQLSRGGLGSTGFLLILHTIRYRILKSTKSLMAENKTTSQQPNVEEAIATLIGLQQELLSFYHLIPTHLKLKDRNILSYSDSDEFANFLSLHSWFFQCCCDLFRICLPGTIRESASAALLTQAPPGFVESWKSLAVSYAVCWAKTWKKVLEMKESRALLIKGHIVPLNPGAAMTAHQCTKILLIAKRYGLYTNVVDPLTQESVALDGECLDDLCSSNVRFLDGPAMVAPVTAVIQQDIKTMMERETRSRSCSGQADRIPITSNVQKRNLLSRYHPLAMVVGESRDESEETRAANASRNAPPPNADPFSALRPMRNIATAPTPTTESIPPIQRLLTPDRQPLPHSLFQLPLDARNDNSLPFGAEGSGIGNGAAFGAYDHSPEYSVAPSQFDMGGELDWFMMGAFLTNQTGDVA